MTNFTFDKQEHGRETHIQHDRETENLKKN